MTTWINDCGSNGSCGIGRLVIRGGTAITTTAAAAAMTAANRNDWGNGSGNNGSSNAGGSNGA